MWWESERFARRGTASREKKQKCRIEWITVRRMMCMQEREREEEKETHEESRWGAIERRKNFEQF